MGRRTINMTGTFKFEIDYMWSFEMKNGKNRGHRKTYKSITNRLPLTFKSSIITIFKKQRNIDVKYYKKITIDSSILVSYQYLRYLWCGVFSKIRFDILIIF